MYSRSNRNIGVTCGLSLEPTANTQQSSQNITNNIIVKSADSEPVVIERSADIAKSADSLAISDTAEPETVDSLLLSIYQSILLKQNKILLANILSKKHIIIYKDDLEKVISTKIGKKVSVILHDFEECGCNANASPFAAVESIVVYEDGRRVDFHVGYNADFVELTEKYALSLKVCCV